MKEFTIGTYLSILPGIFKALQFRVHLIGVQALILSFHLDLKIHDKLYQGCQNIELE